MTPLEIEILIHCHTTPELHLRLHIPAIAEAHKMLEANNLIKQVPGHEYYITTARGCAHMELLRSIPWPVQRWVDQHGNIIGGNDE